MIDSSRILPFSRDRISAVAGRSASSGTSAAVSAAARSAGESADQAGNARCAAVTASAAWTEVADAARPTSDTPSPGSTTRSVSAAAKGTPSMYSPVEISGNWSTVVVMGVTSSCQTVAAALVRHPVWYVSRATTEYGVGLTTARTLNCSCG